MIKKAKRLLGHKFVQGGILLIAVNLITNVLNYLFNLFVGRGLGPVNYGELAAVFSYVLVLSAPLGVIKTIVIRRLGKVGKQRELLAQELLEWFYHFFKKWLIAFLVVLLFIPWLSPFLNLRPYSLLFLILFSPLAFVNGFYLSLFNGLKWFSLIAILSLMATSVKFIGGLLVFWGKIGLVGIFLFVILGVMISTVVGHYVFRKRLDFRHSSSSDLDIKLKSILRSPLFIQTTLVVFSLTLLSNLDVIFIKKFALPQIAGWYGVWSLWAKVILYVLSPLSGLVLIFTSAKEHHHQKNKFLVFSLLSLLFVFVLAFVLYSLKANYLILAIYGDKFLPIAPYLKLAAVFGFLYTVISIFTNFYLAQEDKITLVLPVFIPLQVVFLFIEKTNFSAIMWVEIILSFVLATIYLAYWLLGFRLKTSSFKLKI